MSTFLEHLRAALAPAYELGDELSGAGMSRVFVATDVALGRRVVVKVLPPDLAAGVNRDRFRREIQLAAQLQHPHIVPLLSAGEDGELLYYTMPFIEGESLRARVERKVRFSVRDVMRVLHDVVDALDYAHARGVVHRDIKPGNILTSGAHSLVTDFGVAKALSAAMPTAGMTSSGMAIGTPAYMAPEQLAADPAADQRVDIYAVGLLAYELLSGESPFVGASPTATMAAQLTRDPAPIETVRPDVPAALSQLIMHCLAKDPDRRPATAAALLAELEAIPIPSGATAATIPAQRPVARSSRGWLAGAVGVALVATTAVGAVVLTERSHEAPAPALERSPVVFTGDTTAGVALTPPATPVPARTVLTREDSLAIARAVRDRLDTTAPAKSKGFAAASATPMKDAAIERKLVDSIVRASLAEWSRPGWVGVANAELGKIPRYTERMQSLGRFETLHVPMPPMRTGPRRVVITEPRENPAHPELANVGTAVAERLRDLLRGRKEYAITDPNAVREVLQRTREIAQVAQALDADVIASIDLIPVPGDSVVMLVKIRDLSSEPAYSYRVAGGATMAIADLPPAIDRTANATVRYIDEMSNAPRRMTRVVMVPSGPREGNPAARKPNE